MRRTFKSSGTSEQLHDICRISVLAGTNRFYKGKYGIRLVSDFKGDTKKHSKKSQKRLVGKLEVRTFALAKPGKTGAAKEKSDL